jgi:hypothetical protein
MTVVNNTEIKVFGDIPIKSALIMVQHDDIVALEVEMGGETFTVAAYGDGAVPSIMLTHDKFFAPTDQNQKRDFTKISFIDLKGYKIWSCDREGETLKICMMRYF